jgi:CTP:molybdopterin cytidylyltransferase MocA
MGRDKALLPWPKTDAPTAGPQSTLLSSSIHALSDHCDIVLVIAGANADHLRPVVYACGADVVVNPAPEREQFSSLQVGLHEVLSLGRDSAMVTLVDRPPLQPQTLAALVAAFDCRPHSIWAIVPEYQHAHGHPILIGREMIEAFLRAPVTSNAREVQHAQRQRIAYVETTDALVTTNLDTLEAYASCHSVEAAP